MRIMDDTEFHQLVKADPRTGICGEEAVINIMKETKDSATTK